MRARRPPGNVAGVQRCTGSAGTQFFGALEIREDFLQVRRRKGRLLGDSANQIAHPGRTGNRKIEDLLIDRHNRHSLCACSKAQFRITLGG